MKRKWIALILGLIFLIPNLVFAENIKPTNSFYVYDTTKILSAETKEKIMTTNLAYENTKEQPQVVVVMTKDDIDVDIEAPKIFEEFGIGKKDEDNGVLILFSEATKKMRIEVGYGLEGAITDAQSDEILAKEENNYKSGNNELIDKAVLNVFSDVVTLVEQEYSLDIYDSKSDIGEEELTEGQIMAITIGIVIAVVCWIVLFIFNPELALDILFIFLRILASSSSSSSSGSKGGGGRSGGGGSSR